MNDFINDHHIENLLDQAKNPDPLRVREIIDKALELKGLAPEETAALLQTEDASLVEAILQAAHKIKQDITATVWFCSRPFTSPITAPTIVCTAASGGTTRNFNALR